MHCASSATGDSTLFCWSSELFCIHRDQQLLRRDCDWKKKGKKVDELDIVLLCVTGTSLSAVTKIKKRRLCK